MRNVKTENADFYVAGAFFILIFCSSRRNFLENKKSFFFRNEIKIYSIFGWENYRRHRKGKLSEY